jgi:hypothetical protein
MGTTSFTGPVRSKNGFKTYSVTADTGAVVETITVGDAPVALADADVTLTNATHSGRTLMVPDGTQDNTYTLPSPVAGATFKFVYTGAAADATDFIVDTGADVNFFIGNVAFDDTDDGAASVVFSDGNSNSIFQANVPAAAEVTITAKDGTNWYVSGRVTGATAPTFADQ